METIKRSPAKSPRPCTDAELACVVCGRPVKVTSRTKYVWVHLGGSHAVTKDEGTRLNAVGRTGSDLGLQAIGSDCLRNHPELTAYVQEVQ